MIFAINIPAFVFLFASSGSERKETLKKGDQRLHQCRAMVYYGAETPSSINLPIFEK